MGLNELVGKTILDVQLIKRTFKSYDDQQEYIVGLVFYCNDNSVFRLKSTEYTNKNLALYNERNIDKIIYKKIISIDNEPGHHDDGIEFVIRFKTGNNINDTVQLEWVFIDTQDDPELVFEKIK